MAEGQNGQTTAGFTESMAKFNEAAMHSLTASRLMIAGAVALGAGAAAYFWDPSHRESFMKSMRDFNPLGGSSSGK